MEGIQKHYLARGHSGEEIMPYGAILSNVF